MIIKNLKINKDKIKLCTSCILIATTTAATMKITNIGIPFIQDNIKQNTYNVDIINSEGKTMNYTTTENKDNLLYHYGLWEFDTKHGYRRNYQIYKIQTNSVEQILKSISTTKNMENKLGKPIKEGTEYKELLSTNEKNQNEYWEALIYNKNENDYIIINETNTENLLETLIYVLSTSAFCYIPYSSYKEKKLEKKQSK